MNELNSLLASRRNEWLYVETDYLGRASFKISKGYLSKLFLCMEEILRCCFSCQSLALKTELAIQAVFRESALNVPTEDRDNGHIFSMTQKLVERKNLETACIDQLARCKTIWGRSIQYTPSISNCVRFLGNGVLEEQLKQAESIVKILPWGSPVHKEATAFIETYRRQLSELRLKDPYSGSLDERAQSVSTLAKLKSLLVKREIQDLDMSDWAYNMTHWSVSPRHAELKTAGGYKKQTDYLVLSIRLSTFPERAEDQQEFTDQCVEEILSFVQGQLPGQKTPISIDISSFGLLRESRKPICLQLITKLEKLMSEHPEHFIHRYSLYNEVKGIKENKDPGVCLSRLTGNMAQCKYKNYEKNSFVPKASLRSDVKELIRSLKGVILDLYSRRRTSGYEYFDCFDCILELKTEYELDLDKPLTLKQRVSIYRTLLSLEHRADYMISMNKTGFLCNRLVVGKIFPMLNPHGGFYLEGIAKGFDLEQIPLAQPIPKEFSGWVCRAIIDYAYTQEHPNLPIQRSKEAEQAHLAYFQCLDYLTCGEVVNYPK